MVWAKRGRERSRTGWMAGETGRTANRERRASKTAVIWQVLSQRRLFPPLQQSRIPGETWLLPPEVLFADG